LARTDPAGHLVKKVGLVLVDEAGAVQDGVPASRKIRLPTPRTAMASWDLAACYDEPPSALARRPSSGAPAAPPSAAYDLGRAETVGSPPARGLAELADRIDWDAAPQRLQAGDLSSVDPGVATEIRRTAADPEVIALAVKLRLDPIALIVALIARARAFASRSAARIARAVLGQRLSNGVRRVATKLGLEVGNAPPGES